MYGVEKYGSYIAPIRKHIETVYLFHKISTCFPNLTYIYFSFKKGFFFFNKCKMFIYLFIFTAAVGQSIPHIYTHCTITVVHFLWCFHAEKTPVQNTDTKLCIIKKKVCQFE